MNYITITESPDYVTIVDVNNSGRRYDIHRSLFNIQRPWKVHQLFNDLKIKSWMSPCVLTALKNMIEKEYPDINVNWEEISYSIERTFLDRNVQSIHVKFRGKGKSAYTFG
jgi:hypothetical protein